MEIEKTVEAGKEKIEAEKAWDLLKDASVINAAKGKKNLELKPERRDEVMAAAIGPSGNLRAPTIRIGKEYFIGHSPELYEKLKNSLK